MANNSANVTAGKPNTAGAIYWAPLGTTLPTDTTDTLDAAFVSLGYCSEDGLVNTNSPENDDIKAWGGDTVLSVQTSRDDTFKFTLLEILNLDVCKFVYGNDNVTGALDTGVTITVNNKEVDERALVIDLILRNNTAKRIVIPDGKLSDLGDINYVDNDAVGYETTMTCMPDASGNTHYEYIKRA